MDKPSLDPERRREVGDQVEAALTREVRRFLDSHAGSVRVVDVDDEGVVSLAFEKACAACPTLPVTLEAAVRPVVMGVPGVTDVRAANVNISRHAIARIAALTPPGSTSPTE